MRISTLFTSALISGVALASGLATAQANLNVESFRPSPHPYDLWNIHGSLIAPEMLNYGVSLYFVASGEPLVFKSLALPGEPEHRVVSRQIAADIAASLSIAGWVDLGVSFPFFIDNVGEDVGDGGFIAARPPSGTAAGDLRISLKVAALRAKGDGVGLAVAVDVGTPTGDRTAYTGDEGVTVAPKLIVDYTYKGFSVAFNAGYRVREEVEIVPDLVVDDELLLGLGLQYWFGQRVVGLLGEMDVRTQAASPFSDGNTNNLDLRAGLRWRPGNTILGIDFAGGASALEGYGSTQWQAIVGIRLEPVVAPPDTDGDGINDNVDQCVNQPEDMDGYEDSDGCPDPDNDQDGILDADDRCPTDAEDKDGFEDADGCPDRDNDRDGIPDTDDGCINEPEDKDGFQDADGCPEPDNDKDGFLDADDGCPNEPETVNNYLDQDGCPDTLPRVYVTKERVVITEQVFFATNKSTILRESFSLLMEVGKTLNDNLYIRRVRVEGHTDNQGGAKMNMRLSDRRAKSVMKFLVKQAKVDKRRLEAKGFGLTQPNGDNDTEEGRALNRHSEFVIIEQDAPPVAPHQ